MTLSAQNSNVTTIDNSILVCFDGTNLDKLHHLRKLFEESNLTVIDNAKEHVPSLYQVILYEEEFSNFIPEKWLRESTRRIVITQTPDTHMCELLISKYGVKIVYAEHLPFSLEEARVAFGLIFSKDTHVLTIQDKEEGTTNNKRTIPPVDNNLQTWEEKQKNINSLIHEQYRIPKKSNIGVKRIFLLFRYALLLCIGFFLLHIASLFFSLFLFFGFIYIPQLNFETPLRSAIQFSVVSGKTITQSLPYIPGTKTYDLFLESLDRGSEIIKTINSLTVDKSIISSLTENNTESPITQLEMFNKAWTKTHPQLSLIESNLKFINERVGRWFPFSLLLPQAITLIHTAIESGTMINSVSQFYSQATLGQKTYVFLFQNSNELRPTGGFIGSLAVVQFNNGLIEAFEILDVYDVDGQLRGHIDPPDQIQTLLEQEHWYLRDSNWSPNFRDSADKAAFFLLKSLGTSVDGVIAINLPVLEQLLTVTGPITLPDYNITLSNSSVALFLQDSIKENSFSGSTLKKDLLTDIKNSLLHKVESLSRNQLLHLGSVITDSLLNKDIQLFSYIKNEEDIILKNKWGGVFPAFNMCEKLASPCFQEHTGMIEANLGVNKNSRYIERSISKELEIFPNEMKRKETYTWINTASEESSPSGNYKMYVRFYYPTGTTLQEVSINNIKTPITDATTSARLLPYAELLDEVSGFVTLGLGINIPQQEKISVSISSNQPFILPPKTLVAEIYKQSGVPSMPFEISLTAGEGIKNIINSSDLSVAKSNSVTYNTSLWRDNRLFFNIITEEP